MPGVSVSAIWSLTSSILVDLLGLPLLVPSFGAVMFVRGAASLLGAPFAGWVVDVTGTVLGYLIFWDLKNV